MPPLPKLWSLTIVSRQARLIGGPAHQGEMILQSQTPCHLTNSPYPENGFMSQHVLSHPSVLMRIFCKHCTYHVVQMLKHHVTLRMKESIPSFHLLFRMPIWRLEPFMHHIVDLQCLQLTSSVHFLSAKYWFESLLNPSEKQLTFYSCPTNKFKVISLPFPQTQVLGHRPAHSPLQESYCQFLGLLSHSCPPYFRTCGECITYPLRINTQGEEVAESVGEVVKLHKMSVISYCHIIISSCCHSVMLPYWHIFMMSCWNDVMLLYHHVAISSYCFIVTLSCCQILRLSYHDVVVLSYCHAVMLQCCNVLMSYICLLRLGKDVEVHNMFVSVQSSHDRMCW